MGVSIFTTVITGVSVFVLGQILLKWIIDPIMNFKEQLGKTSLLFLSRQASITNVTYEELLVKDLKECAANLMAKKMAIPFFLYLHKIIKLPSPENITQAALSINYIASLIDRNRPKSPLYPEIDSTGYYSFEISKRIVDIQKNLSIVTSYTTISAESY